ncbi:hypothetical protein L7F22_018450 [Adiantum nelumboides]|nr:hypothetical protein [Adiantum nelumboides]
MKVFVSSGTSQDESFLEFLSLYPSYKSTMAIDALRHEEYPHLDKEGQVCLDYTGVGLFSSLQRNPELYGGSGIGLSPTSANLATHAMYMEGGSTESFFRKRVLQHLSLDEDDYYIVFTANAVSAFKLLAHSYPFHEAHNFLSAYDHECEGLEAIRDCAHSKGAHIQSVNLIHPLSRIDADDLRRKLQGKRKSTTHKVCSKGLFVYPHMSRVTGCKNSSQWIPEAQQNGWHVLLDVTSADSKFSDALGLALFCPDFLICSFYYVFGEDPTGFGCLLVKRSVLRTLGDSSRARAIGMVKIVTKQAFLTSPDESSEMSTLAVDRRVQLLRNNPGHRRTCSMRDLSFEKELLAHVNTLNLVELNAPEESFGLAKVPSTHNNEVGSASVSRLSCNSSTAVYFEEIAATRRQITGDKVEAKQHEQSLDSASMSSILEAANSELWHSRKEMSFCNPTGESPDIKCLVPFGLGDIASRPPESSSRARMHGVSMDMHFACRGLDHADILGYKGIAVRLRTLSSWLISSLLRLRHPEPDSTPLVKIYSPWSLAEGGSVVAFTLSDSAGKVFEPKRVQMLADRNSISLRMGIITGTISLDVQETMEDFWDVGCVELSNHKWRSRGEMIRNVHLPVVYASLGFLNNYFDVYRLLLFISKFLDPDFVSQELWHYQALNQETIEI